MEIGVSDDKSENDLLFLGETRILIGCDWQSNGWKLIDFFIFTKKGIEKGCMMLKGEEMVVHDAKSIWYVRRDYSIENSTDAKIET